MGGVSQKTNADSPSRTVTATGAPARSRGEVVRVLNERAGRSQEAESAWLKVGRQALVWASGAGPAVGVVMAAPLLELR